jgi:hypothetical protein
MFTVAGSLTSRAITATPFKAGGFPEEQILPDNENKLHLQEIIGNSNPLQ